MNEFNDPDAETADIRECLLRKNARVHMLGICGVGMAGLAFFLKKRGFAVSGCDNSPNHLASWLKKNGIPVFSGHAPSHVKNSGWIVKSAAVPDDIPELTEAKKSGKKIFRRGLVLAQLVSDADSICVCGTHGKTTTTAMIAQLLQKTGQKPSFCVGGEISSLGGIAGQGAGNAMVVEADESDGTLAYYHPRLTVITNIEFDHAEHFASFAELKRCFSAVAAQTRKKIIYCFDDMESRKMLRGRPNALSYGFSPGADLRLTNFRENSGGLSFFLKMKTGLRQPWPSSGRLPCAERPAHPDARKSGWGGRRHPDAVSATIILPVPGRHNALNAAAACAVGLELSIPIKHITSAMKSFQPARRRFERIIDTKDFLAISDYAHHPSEISALMQSARRLGRRRLLAVFQPHRYSRTAALGKNFPPAFAGVSELILCPVYAASEKPMPGGLSADLYGHFRKYGKIKAYKAASLQQAWDYLKTIIRPGDAILIVGAGDICSIGEWAKKELSAGKHTTSNVQRSIFQSRTDPPEAGDFEAKPCRSKLEVESWKFNVSKILGVKLKSCSIKLNEPLAPKTTLGVGGTADVFIEVGDKNDLAAIVKWAHKNGLSLKIMGAGGNLLVSDLGVRGAVARLKGPAWQNIVPIDSTRIIAGAGVRLHTLVNWTAQHGLAGAEFLAGIPGTVGGAARMNAGACGHAVGEIIEQVKTIEPDGTFTTLDKKQCAFAYRSCPALENRIALEAVFRLKKGEPGAISGMIAANLQKRKWMRGFRSAGSIFKNPPGESAGRLIESLPLKGETIGGAVVSRRHANIIVTKKHANASDVFSLIEIIRFMIRMKHGIELEKEVEFWE